MIVTDIISIVLLAILLFWTLYNGSIIYVGIKKKQKHTAFISNKTDELPKISLIVPTKNEETVIRRCLNGILNVDYPKDKMQIIVVDGKSEDNTGKICSEFSEKYPENIKIISEKTPNGKPAALNLALPYINGEIVVFLMLTVFPKKTS